MVLGEDVKATVEFAIAREGTTIFREVMDQNPCSKFEFEVEGTTLSAVVTIWEKWKRHRDIWIPVQ